MGKFRVGGQLGSNSYPAAKKVSDGALVSVFYNNDDAKVAMIRGQIDVLALDLPTAFAVQG